VAYVTQWLTFDVALNDLKQRSMSFILVPVDSSYTTTYRLSLVTIAIGRTV